MDGETPSDNSPDPIGPKPGEPIPGASGPLYGGSGNEIPNGPAPAGNGGDSSMERQEVKHAPLSARVPERVARGVLSNGIAILDSPTEFVMDFFQGLTRPPLIVGRVVMAPRTFGSFLQALRENFGRFTQTFGPPTPLPPPPANRPSLQEIYDTYRLPEELLSGSYSNSVMISHSPSEFHFDFITGFYPTAAVSTRIFMAAPHVPRVLAAMTNAIKQFEQRHQQRLGGSANAPERRQSPDGAADAATE